MEQGNQEVATQPQKPIVVNQLTKIEKAKRIGFRATIATWGKTAMLAAHTVLGKYKEAKQKKRPTSRYIRSKDSALYGRDAVFQVMCNAEPRADLQPLSYAMRQTPSNMSLEHIPKAEYLHSSISVQRILENLRFKGEQRAVAEMFDEVQSIKARINKLLIVNGLGDLILDVGPRDTPVPPSRSCMSFFQEEIMSRLMDDDSDEYLYPSQRKEEEDNAVSEADIPNKIWIKFKEKLVKEFEDESKKRDYAVRKNRSRMLTIIDDYVETCEVRLHAMEDVGDWLFTIEDIEHFIGPLECEIDKQKRDMERVYESVMVSQDSRNVLVDKIRLIGKKLFTLLRKKKALIKKLRLLDAKRSNIFDIRAGKPPDMSFSILDETSMTNDDNAMLKAIGNISKTMVEMKKFIKNTELSNALMQCGAQLKSLENASRNRMIIAKQKNKECAEFREKSAGLQSEVAKLMATIKEEQQESFKLRAKLAKMNEYNKKLLNRITSTSERWHEAKEEARKLGRQTTYSPTIEKELKREIKRRSRRSQPKIRKGSHKFGGNAAAKSDEEADEVFTKVLQADTINEYEEEEQRIHDLSIKSQQQADQIEYLKQALEDSRNETQSALDKLRSEKDKLRSEKKENQSTCKELRIERKITQERNKEILKTVEEVQSLRQKIEVLEKELATSQPVIKKLSGENLLYAGESLQPTVELSTSSQAKEEMRYELDDLANMLQTQHRKGKKSKERKVSRRGTTSRTKSRSPAKATLLRPQNQRRVSRSPSSSDEERPKSPRRKKIAARSAATSPLPSSASSWVDTNADVNSKQLPKIKFAKGKGVPEESGKELSLALSKGGKISPPTLSKMGIAGRSQPEIKKSSDQGMFSKLMAELSQELVHEFGHLKSEHKSPMSVKSQVASKRSRFVVETTSSTRLQPQGPFDFSRNDKRTGSTEIKLMQPSEVSLHALHTSARGQLLPAHPVEQSDDKKLEDDLSKKSKRAMSICDATATDDQAKQPSSLLKHRGPQSSVSHAPVKSSARVRGSTLAHVTFSSHKTQHEKCSKIIQHLKSSLPEIISSSDSDVKLYVKQVEYLEHFMKELQEDSEIKNTQLKYHVQQISNLSSQMQDMQVEHAKQLEAATTSSSLDLLEKRELLVQLPEIEGYIQSVLPTLKKHAKKVVHNLKQKFEVELFKNMLYLNAEERKFVKQRDKMEKEHGDYVKGVSKEVYRVLRAMNRFKEAVIALLNKEGLNFSSATIKLIPDVGMDGDLEKMHTSAETAIDMLMAVEFRLLQALARRRKGEGALVTKTSDIFEREMYLMLKGEESSSLMPKRLKELTEKIADLEKELGLLRMQDEEKFKGLKSRYDKLALDHTKTLDEMNNIVKLLQSLRRSPDLEVASRGYNVEHFRQAMEKVCIYPKQVVYIYVYDRLYETDVQLQRPMRSYSALDLASGHKRTDVLAKQLHRPFRQDAQLLGHSPDLSSANRKSYDKKRSSKDRRHSAVEDDKDRGKVFSSAKIGKISDRAPHRPSDTDDHHGRTRNLPFDSKERLQVTDGRQRRHTIADNSTKRPRERFFSVQEPHSPLGKDVSGLSGDKQDLLVPLSFDHMMDLFDNKAGSKSQNKPLPMDRRRFSGVSGPTSASKKVVQVSDKKPAIPVSVVTVAKKQFDFDTIMNTSFTRMNPLLPAKSAKLAKNRSQRKCQEHEADSSASDAVKFLSIQSHVAPSPKEDQQQIGHEISADPNDFLGQKTEDFSLIQKVTPSSRLTFQLNQTWPSASTHALGPQASVYTAVSENKVSQMQSRKVAESAKMKYEKALQARGEKVAKGKIVKPDVSLQETKDVGAKVIRRSRTERGDIHTMHSEKQMKDSSEDFRKTRHSAAQAKDFERVVNKRSKSSFKKAGKELEIKHEVTCDSTSSVHVVTSDIIDVKEERPMSLGQKESVHSKDSVPESPANAEKIKLETVLCRDEYLLSPHRDHEDGACYVAVSVQQKNLNTPVKAFYISGDKNKQSHVTCSAEVQARLEEAESRSFEGRKDEVTYIEGISEGKQVEVVLVESVSEASKSVEDTSEGKQAEVVPVKSTFEVKTAEVGPVQGKSEARKAKVSVECISKEKKAEVGPVQGKSEARSAEVGSVDPMSGDRKAEVPVEGTTKGKKAEVGPAEGVSGGRKVDVESVHGVSEPASEGRKVDVESVGRMSEDRKAGIKPPEDSSQDRDVDSEQMNSMSKGKKTEIEPIESRSEHRMDDVEPLEGTSEGRKAEVGSIESLSKSITVQAEEVKYDTSGGKEVSLQPFMYQNAVLDKGKEEVGTCRNSEGKKLSVCMSDISHQLSVSDKDKPAYGSSGSLPPLVDTMPMPGVGTGLAAHVPGREESQRLVVREFVDSFFSLGVPAPPGKSRLPVIAPIPERIPGKTWDERKINQNVAGKSIDASSHEHLLPSAGAWVRRRKFEEQKPPSKQARTRGALLNTPFISQYLEYTQPKPPSTPVKLNIVLDKKLLSTGLMDRIEEGVIADVESQRDMVPSQPTEVQKFQNLTESVKSEVAHQLVEQQVTREKHQVLQVMLQQHKVMAEKIKAAVDKQHKAAVQELTQLKAMHKRNLLEIKNLFESEKLSERQYNLLFNVIEDLIFLPQEYIKVLNEQRTLVINARRAQEELEALLKDSTINAEKMEAAENTLNTSGEQLMKREVATDNYKASKMALEKTAAIVFAQVKEECGVELTLSLTQVADQLKDQERQEMAKLLTEVKESSMLTVSMKPSTPSKRLRPPTAVISRLPKADESTISGVGLQRKMSTEQKKLYNRFTALRPPATVDISPGLTKLEELDMDYMKKAVEKSFRQFEVMRRRVKTLTDVRTHCGDLPIVEGMDYTSDTVVTLRDMYTAHSDATDISTLVEDLPNLLQKSGMTNVKDATSKHSKPMDN